MQHRRSVARLCVLALAVVPACYAPHNPIVGDGSAEDGSGGSSAETGSEGPTTSATTGPSTSADSATTDPDGSSDASGESGPAVCGNGTVEGDEVCDDGINDGSYDGCEPDCTALGPHCGDAVAQADEACDDGDDVNGNGCNVNCIESGTVLWSRTYEQDSWEAMAIDADDGILVGNDTLLQYLDDAGNEGWSDMSDPAGFTAGTVNGIAFHATEAWLVGGGGSYPNQSGNAWWRPFSGRGAPGTAQSYDNPAHSSDWISDVAFNEDGQYYTCGGSDRSDLGQGDNLWLRKHDVDGDELWTQNYDGGQDDNCLAVAVGSDGYVAVGGLSMAPGEGANAWLRKYGPEGNVEWTRSSASGGDSSDWISDVAIAPDLSVVATGGEGLDIWVRSYSSDGNVQWTSTYGVGGPCVAEGCANASVGRGVAVDSAGAVIAVGRSAVTEYETWVRKYDATGNELWTDVTAPDPSFYEQGARAVAVASDDAILVVGAWDATSGTNDAQAWIQKYAP